MQNEGMLWPLLFALNLSAAQITGIVTDIRTGAPVPSAKIRIQAFPGYASDAQEILTDSNGRFTAEVARPALYVVDCMKPGYVTIEGGLRQMPYFEISPDQKRIDPILIALQPASTLSGKLLSSEGKPISLAKVESSLTRQSAVTDANGEFSLQNLPPCPRKCSLTFSLDIADRRKLSSPSASNPKVSMGPPPSFEHPLNTWLAGESVSSIEVRLPKVPLVSFSGTILNPPPDPKVLLYRSDKPLLPGMVIPQALVDGKFGFELVQPGSYNLKILSADDDRRAAPILSFQVDGLADITGQRISLPASAKVSGIAHLEGKPFFLPGLSITFNAFIGMDLSSASARVQRDGTFQFEQLFPGKWSPGMTFTGGGPDLGFIVQPAEHTLQAGQNPSIVVNFVKTQTAQGRILNQQGNPADGFVAFKAQGGQPATLIPTDGKGYFRIGLIPSTYLVWAIPMNSEGSRTEQPPCASHKTITVGSAPLNFDIQLCP